MNNFMIKKLLVSGVGMETGEVGFTDGLNIIRGRSNTGKTWILKCIYYLFGSNEVPFAANTGYSHIEGIFATRDYGEIIISRELGGSVAIVNTESNEIETGAYDVNYTGKGPLYLNDLWIKIIGLDEMVFIPKTSRYARERISWTNIASVFYVDENEIDSSGSIIFKDSYTETAIVASLYYLLTGDNKEGIEEILKPEVASVKKKAVVDFIDEQVQALSDKKVSYIMQLEELDGVDVGSKIDDVSASIQETKQEIEELMLENTAIVKQKVLYQQQEANCTVLIDRYEALVSQYKADLQRMDFIVKGERAVKGVPSNGVCPFCGGEVLHEDESYIEAINAEIQRIASEITIIVTTEEDVKDDREALRIKINELDERRVEIGSALDDKNRQLQIYKSDLERYKDYTSLQSGIDFVNEQLKVLGNKKISELQKKKNPPLFYPKKELEECISEELNALLNDILIKCNYRSGFANWDFKIFDIVMDGIPKSEDQGKGYRSFLNSVIALAFYSLFNSTESYIKPGILMIDTPLLGFDERVDASNRETIKDGLYKYFIEHTVGGQVIIVDNLNVMPDIDFESKGINVVTYHKDEKDGHVYGFMPSWRKDLPKE